MILSLRKVLKKYLPDPNPTKVELAKNSSLKTIFKKATELYFSDVDDTSSYKLCIADSNGIPLHIDRSESWILSDFFQHNGLHPSRYKIYVMLEFESVVSLFKKGHVLIIHNAIIITLHTYQKDDDDAPTDVVDDDDPTDVVAKLGK